MNWTHFRAFVWLRWRLRVNQFRKAGTVNAVLSAILAPILVLSSVSLTIGMFFVGYLAYDKIRAFVIEKSPPYTLMFIWDGMIIVFLFVWIVSLMAELQRSEGLSLQKFLHLPVSCTSAFLCNYLSSLASINIALFAPAMLALCVGLICSQGPAMLMLLPLTAAFFLMVTALTYQFQGWLASLMVNPRRRRTIIVTIPVVFALIIQLPNLISILVQREQDAKMEQRHAKSLPPSTKEPHKSGKNKIGNMENRTKPVNNFADPKLNGIKIANSYAYLINVALPPGWLPVGAMEIADGNPWPAILGFLGMTLIGAGSLARSYQTTLRIYTGHFTSGKGQAKVAKPLAPPKKASVAMLEKTIPLISEQAAAIAMASLRGLLRAPEAKTMLLTPAILIVLFIVAFARTADMVEVLRPFVAFGGMATVTLGLTAMIGNQFGFDRNGFRVFVLCAASRKDILLGKNLAVAPLSFLMAAVVVFCLQVMAPMRIDLFLALIPQFIVMYLTVSLVANCLSILAPMAIAPGALQPTNPKLVPILLQMVFVFALPFLLAPALVPLGIELISEKLFEAPTLPIALVLSTIECLLAVLLYRLILDWQGMWLQAREQRILEIVAAKAQ